MHDETPRLLRQPPNYISHGCCVTVEIEVDGFLRRHCYTRAAFLEAHARAKSIVQELHAEPNPPIALDCPHEVFVPDH